MKQLVKCPHCGKDYYTIQVAFDGGGTCLNFDKTSTCFIEKCNFCGNYIFIRKNKSNDEIVFYYPSKPNIDIPEEIEEFSPKTVKIYTQSLKAKAENLNLIVGAGLRRTLEQLVTDYLLEVQKENRDEILSLNLHKRIEKLDKTVYAKPCAMIVKIIGNDEVHFESKYDLDVQLMIDYLNTLMLSMRSVYISKKAMLQMDELVKRKL